MGPGRGTICMSGPRRFVDTNIWVYDLDESPEEAAKHRIAGLLLDEDPDRLVLSTQVLQELYVAITRKLRQPLTLELAARAVASLTRLNVVAVDTSIVLAAIETSRDAVISFWDALLIEAARSAGCERLLTEDLSHGQVIRGILIENPFRAVA